jgi:hypothetical protein
VFIHSVYFWLKEGLKEGDLEQFKRGIKSLTGIETVRRSYIGVPASTDRPVIERGYSYSLILTFDDKKGHDAYQEDEVHERFRQDCSPCWSKVVIYDCVEASHLDD